MCAHTIACAYIDGNLQQFISQVTGQPSFYALAKSGSAEKTGKKPNKKRKASAKSTTHALSTLQKEITPVVCSGEGSSAVQADPPHTAVRTVSSAVHASTTPVNLTCVASTTTSTSTATASSSFSGSRSPLNVEQSRPAHDQCVRITQAGSFTNNSILISSSVAQSPVISVCQPTSKVSRSAYTAVPPISTSQLSPVTSCFSFSAVCYSDCFFHCSFPS